MEDTGLAPVSRRVISSGRASGQVRLFRTMADGEVETLAMPDLIARPAPGAARLLTSTTRPAECAAKLLMHGIGHRAPGRDAAWTATIVPNGGGCGGLR